jgi:protein-tyrosine phosphatase
MDCIKEMYLGIVAVPLDEIIQDFLYIGSIFDYEDHNKLLQLGITHILDTSSVTTTPCNIVNIKRHFKYVKIPMQDTPSFPINLFFDKTFELLDEVYNSKGKKVLVNCHMGRSRSVTIVLNYMMKKFNLRFEDAFAIVKQKRNCISPNTGFIRQLTS